MHKDYDSIDLLASTDKIKIIIMLLSQLFFFFFFVFFVCFFCFLFCILFVFCLFGWFFFGLFLALIALVALKIAIRKANIVWFFLHGTTHPYLPGVAINFRKNATIVRSFFGISTVIPCHLKKTEKKIDYLST